MSSRRAPVLLLSWSLLLAFGWFWPSLAHGFRSDDFLASYYWNATDGADWSRAVAEFARPWFGVRDLYRPLVSMSFAANFELGSGPFGFHVFNTLLLALTAFAAGSIALRVAPAGRGLAAAVAVAVVVMHPASVETTAWMSARTAGLEVCFSTLAALAFVRRLQGDGGMTPVLLASSCALLSKEGAVMLPLLLLAVDLVVAWKRPLRERLRLHAPVISLVVVYFVWRRLLLGVFATAEAGHSLFERLAVVAVRSVTWIAPPGPDQQVHWSAAIGLFALLLLATGPSRARAGILLLCGALLLLPTSQMSEAIGLMSGRLLISSVPVLAVAVALCVATALGRTRAKWAAMLALSLLLGSLGAAGRSWLYRYGEEDALLADLRRELAVASSGGGPGRPIGVSMLPGLPLLQTHLWGMLGVEPYSERDAALATLAGMLQLDPDAPSLFGDAAMAHALAELGGGAVTWNPDRRTFVPVARPEHARVELTADPREKGAFAASMLLPATAFAAIEVVAPAPVRSIRLRLRDDLQGAWAFGAIEQTFAVAQRTATFDATHAIAVQLFAANGAPFRGFTVECDGAPAPNGTVVVAHASLPTEPLRAPLQGRDIEVDRFVASLQPPRKDLPLRLYLMTPLRTMSLDAVAGSALAMPAVERDRLALSAALVDGCAAHWFWQTPTGYQGTPWRSGLDWCRLR